MSEGFFHYHLFFFKAYLTLYRKRMKEIKVYKVPQREGNK